MTGPRSRFVVMSGTQGPSSESHVLHTASSGVPPLCALPSLDLGSARVTPPSYSAVFSLFALQM